ncbi:hypothetical protein HYALB_00000160 [Hymenoscyphus albidus]|uniref:Uncharacterized protein n=1 Tax=Hymenoscyphus albidus TaxID=595503 RepID=A0A9N9Q3H8_9HELO|nr:hypothetical protein HYALB_00000160 [Hymenoscyphus albidus]
MDQIVSRYLTRIPLSRSKLIVPNNAPSCPLWLDCSLGTWSELSSTLDWDARMAMQKLSWARCSMESVSRKGYCAGSLKAWNDWSKCSAPALVLSSNPINGRCLVEDYLGGHSGSGTLALRLSVSLLVTLGVRQLQHILPNCAFQALVVETRKSKSGGKGFQGVEG